MRTEVRIVWAMLATSAVLVAEGATACGFCIEDREAAVYDHAVIATAQARKHSVAFFAIEGQVRTDEASRRAVVAALESAGDKSTARVALPSASCSVAFDPARISLARLAAHANKMLASKGLKLEPLRLAPENDGLAKAE